MITSSIINQNTLTEGHRNDFPNPHKHVIILNENPVLPPEFINTTDFGFADPATAGPSIFDRLISVGVENQNAGWKKLLPVIDASKLESSNYPMYQATMGVTKMAYGTGQIATGEILKAAYNNPKEAMSCITIPAMMGIVMYDSYQRNLANRS